MTSDILQYEILESRPSANERTFTARIDSELLNRMDGDFDASASSFWFRFFGEVDFYAGQFEGLTDVTLHLALSDDGKTDLELAGSVLSRLAKRAAWGEHVAMLESSNVDAILITFENVGSESAPRIPSAEESERLAIVRAAFTDMLDASEPDDKNRADLARKIDRPADRRI